MSKQKMYYKVVAHRSSTPGAANYTSMHATNDYSINYKLNKQIKGKNKTPLFIFDTYENALDYKDCAIPCGVIYKCTATNVRKPYKLITTFRGCISAYWRVVKNARKQKKSIERALQNSKIRDFIKSSQRAWAGTLWADSVILTEQV